MSDGRDIVCSRVVFEDSEFDAKKGRGERPGPPVCICAIEVDQDGREIEHRLAAPYPVRAPWDRGDPFLTIGFALSAGRNNPSTNRSLFGLPHTMRSFMQPLPGMALAQSDFGCEEIGIAAAYSRDPTLIADYKAGDPYRAFAAASLGILNPTKQQRQTYKVIVLGRIYGMGAATLARNAGISKAEAQCILDEMAARYPVLEAWLARILVEAAHCIPITCVHGWSLAMTGKAGEERTFLNFPMQANAAELMRTVFVRSPHLPLIWCAHDSFLVEDTIDRIEQTAAEMQAIMREASRDLLGGFELRADCDPDKHITRYPDRFVDEREREDGMQHWNWLMALTAENDDGPAHPADGIAAVDRDTAATTTPAGDFRPHPARQGGGTVPAQNR